MADWFDSQTDLDLTGIQNWGDYNPGQQGGRAQAPGLQAAPPEAQAPARTYQAPSGWEQDRLNDLNDKSGKYVMQRWLQDNGYGPGGDKQYNADAVRAFVASQNGQWEMQGSVDDPQIRQTQAYLNTHDPGRETRWQDVIRDSGPGGANGMSFSNAETRPGEAGYEAPGGGRAQGPGLLPSPMPTANLGNPGGGNPGNAGGWDGQKYTSTPLTAPVAYQPQSVAGPERLNLASLAQPDAVKADQVGPGQQVTAGTVQQGDRVTASQVTGPEKLSAAQLAQPDEFQNLTADELTQDPSYQFRLKQGLGAMQASAAAKGTLFGGDTLKGLQDYAGQSASQEYAAANARKAGAFQTNVTNRANTTGQNNAANAQAYGLTNQYQQQAQLANQQAGMQAGMFNSGQQQQANLANVGNALQAGQFNSAQGQQAALANQQANLNAGQFNAGMNFNTQQGNINNQLNAYNAYQPLNQQNQQFNAQRQDQANQQNFNNQFNVEQANNANAQNAWQGNTNAALGQGNLNLGYTQAGNNFALGQGNLALGNRQADQSFALGMGNLNLNQQGQAFNQGLQTFGTNYGVWRDNRDFNFNSNYALAGLGQNAAAGYGNQVGNAYTNQGNANAAAGIAGANAWSGALGNIGNAAQQYGYWAGQGGGLVLDPNQRGQYSTTGEYLGE